MAVPATDTQDATLAPPGRQDRVYMRLFSFTKPAFVPSRPAFEPPTDVYETETEIVVRMEIAGGDLKPEVHYEPTTQQLIIRGRRRDPAEGLSRTYHQLEVVYGVFERALSIPVPVDNDQITATYENGFLQVRLPKSAIEPRAYRIEIR